MTLWIYGTIAHFPQAPAEKFFPIALTHLAKSGKNLCFNAGIAAYISCVVQHPSPQFTQIIYILSNHVMLLLRARLTPVLCTVTMLSEYCSGTVEILIPVAVSKNPPAPFLDTALWSSRRPVPQGHTWAAWAAMAVVVG